MFHLVVAKMVYRIVLGKGEGKVVPVFFLTEHNTMKVYWRGEV
jgi:hypothetical protein